MNIAFNDQHFKNVKYVTLDKIDTIGNIIIKIEPKTDKEVSIKIKKGDIMIISIQDS